MQIMKSINPKYKKEEKSMKPTWNETPFCLNVNPKASPRPVVRGADEFTSKKESDEKYFGDIVSIRPGGEKA